jgi:hypothetical protein
VAVVTVAQHGVAGPAGGSYMVSWPGVVGGGGGGRRGFLGRGGHAAREV